VTDLRSSALPGALQAGDRLAGRYVLLEQVGGGPTCLWRADDEVLARPVAVRLADASGAGGRLAVQPLLDAAVRTGAASHPGLVRVYDADVQALPSGPVAYVISEWVDGRRLDDLLQDDGPLDGPEASDLVRQVAVHEVACGKVHGDAHTVQRGIVLPGDAAAHRLFEDLGGERADQSAVLDDWHEVGGG